jgi:hypothetical protein
MTTNRITLQSYKPIQIERPHASDTTAEEQAKELARLLIEAARSDAVDYLIDAIANMLILTQVLEGEPFTRTHARSLALIPVYRIAGLEPPERRFAPVPRESGQA